MKVLCNCVGLFMNIPGSPSLEPFFFFFFFFFFFSWFRVCQVLYWFVYDIGVQEENDKRYNRRFHERDQHTCVNSGSVDTLRRRNFENASFFSSVRPTVHTNPSRKRSFSKTLFKLEEFTEENVGSSFLIAQKTFWKRSFSLARRHGNHMMARDGVSPKHESKWSVIVA